MVRQLLRPTECMAGAGEITTIDLGTLVVDHSYQRMVDQKRVKRIIDNFRPELVGVVIAHKRPSGRTVILDGQHRVEALREMFGPNHRIQAQIHQGLTPAEEAELFAQLNTQRKAVGPIALWWASLTARDEDVLKIKGVLDKHGIEVARERDAGKRPDRLYAVGALQRISRPGLKNRGSGIDVEHVDRVLRVIRTAWPTSPEALQDDVLKGVSSFLRKYGDIVDEDRLIAALQRDGVIDIRHRYKALKTTLRFASDKAFAGAILGSYNYKLRENSRLPEWDSVS